VSAFFEQEDRHENVKAYERVMSLEPRNLFHDVHDAEESRVEDMYPKTVECYEFHL
jgi:hypothetical protein